MSAANRGEHQEYIGFLPPLDSPYRISSASTTTICGQSKTCYTSKRGRTSVCAPEPSQPAPPSIYSTSSTIQGKVGRERTRTIKGAESKTQNQRPGASWQNCSPESEMGHITQCRLGQSPISKSLVQDSGEVIYICGCTAQCNGFFKYFCYCGAGYLVRRLA